MWIAERLGCGWGGGWCAEAHPTGQVVIPVIAAILICTGASKAQAEDCGNKQTQTEMNICSFAEFQAADAELNAAYQEILKRLDGDTDTTKLLIATQRNWIAFREAECKFRSHKVETGSIHPFSINNCMTRLTQDRILQFDYYLNCEEGDMSCPVPRRD